MSLYIVLRSIDGQANKIGGSFLMFHFWHNGVDAFYPVVRIVQVIKRPQKKIPCQSPASAFGAKINS